MALSNLSVNGPARYKIGVDRSGDRQGVGILLMGGLGVIERNGGGLLLFDKVFDLEVAECKIAVAGSTRSTSWQRRIRESFDPYCCPLACRKCGSERDGFLIGCIADG